MTTQSRNKREGWYAGFNRGWYHLGHSRTRQIYARQHKPGKIFEMEIGRVENFRFISSDMINP